MAEQMAGLEQYIRDVNDFPKAGIVFKDITTLLAHPDALRQAIDQMAAPFRDRGITKVAAMESRGFIFGTSIALDLQCGFVPIRKPGKLPWTKRRHEYILEYGSDALEMHDDAMEANDRVLIVDDVLATGGTAEAAAMLVSQTAAQILGYSFLIELDFLNGREKIGKYEIQSVIHY